MYDSYLYRADEKYGWIRRIQLQDYLRALVKIRVLRNESLSFWKFICMPKRVMYNTGTDHTGADDEERLSFQSSASERSNTTTGTATTSGTTGKGGRATTSTGSIMKPIERKTSSKLATANTDNTNTTGTTTTTTNGTIQDTPTEIDQDDINYESDENKSAYNPEKDLELFQESVQLAASEAALRSRYGTNRTTKADIDNIAALVRTNSISTTNSHIIPTNLTNLTNSSNGSIKLNKVYDDNGEEIIPDQVNAYNEDNMKDLSYLAASNARLNVRLTSSDTLLSSPASSYSSSNIHTHMKESNTTSNSSGIKAPVITAPTAWSNNDLATALEAINSKDTFDMDLHFSGPRSGPPSVHASPNVSTTTLSESDLHRPVQILPPSSSGSGSRNRQGSEEESKIVGGSNGQKTTTLPPPPSTAANSSSNSTPSSSSSSANQTILSPPSSQGNKHNENQKKRRSSKSDH